VNENNKNDIHFLISHPGILGAKKISFGSKQEFDPIRLGWNFSSPQALKNLDIMYGHEKAIYSDIKSVDGSSGGPLFNQNGLQGILSASLSGDESSFVEINYIHSQILHRFGENKTSRLFDCKSSL